MINQVTLVGRLTRDPDLRVTTEGTPVTHVTIAVNRHYKNQNGQIEADFVQCTLWRKAAENTVKFCRKGSVVGVTGRIQTRNYENSEGRKVYVTEVVAEAIQFLGKKTPESEEEPVSAGSASSHAPYASYAKHQCIKCIIFFTCIINASLPTSQDPAH